MNTKTMHSSTPSFTEEQILFLLPRADILNFHEQSCSYITQFLRSGRLFKMAIYQPFSTPLVMAQPGFHALSRADINWFIVKKRL